MGIYFLFSSDSKQTFGGRGCNLLCKLKQHLLHKYLFMTSVHCSAQSGMARLCQIIKVERFYTIFMLEKSYAYHHTFDVC